MDDLNVLLCDDSEDVRSKLANLLNKCGIQQVYQLTDGSEVLDFLIQNFSDESKRVNLLITDYIMQEKDGLTLVKEIREFSSKKKELEAYIQKLPIIVATAEGETNSMLSFVEAGVNTYILKPCDKITLIERIKIALD